MSAVAIVPARAGSEGLPGKNGRVCAGKPLLVWSVEAARDSGLVDRVVVSSDSQDYLRKAVLSGADALRRPDELATPTASTDAVLIHAAHALGLSGDDEIVLLQPTVPVREPGLIDRCISLRRESGADSVFTAYPLHFVWWREALSWEGRAPEKAAREWRTQCPRRPRRQDMLGRELMWAEDGSVYVTTVRHLLMTGERLGGHTEMVETRQTVDVDTAEDFALADALLRIMHPDQVPTVVAC